jgi:hypothetical protein
LFRRYGEGFGHRRMGAESLKTKDGAI